MHEKDMYPGVEKFLKTKRIVDAQIDKLVYDLYGLTEEVKVLEHESRESIDQQVKLGLDMVDVDLNTFARYGK